MENNRTNIVVKEARAIVQKVKGVKTCPECKGTQVVDCHELPYVSFETCPTCGGTGEGTDDVNPVNKMTAKTAKDLSDSIILTPDMMEDVYDNIRSATAQGVYKQSIFLGHGTYSLTGKAIPKSLFEAVRLQLIEDGYTCEKDIKDGSVLIVDWSNVS